MQNSLQVFQWNVRFNNQLIDFTQMTTDGGALKTDMFKDIRKLINIIDELRDYGLDKQISLPRIAVLGTQSSGKSSLLENVVGLDFLPRGSGVVTRRPLQLRLVHLDPRHAQGKPYALFDNDKDNKKYTDFNQVRDNIQKLTDDVAGSGANIVDDPIKLKIFSVDCPDLTIIDLPGITRIDMKGQKDVQRITTEMAKRYCSDPKTIILCVIPANQDLSTSDGLKLAREWDPKGQRTIGVITKIDIMDKGTNAKRMLNNQEIFLKLGYIGIVNRAQQDIKNKVPVEVSLKNEVKFFNSHPDYKDLPQKAIGTKSLTTKLSEQLVEGIKRSLPGILKQVQEKLNTLKQQFDAMGVPPPASSRQKSNFLMNLISEFANDYRNTLSGRYVANSRSQTEQIGRGAVIKGKFKHIFKTFTDTHYKCSAEYDDDFIKGSLRSHQGDQISGFPSMECFRSLLTPQLAKLKQPIHSTLEQIYQELLELAGQLNTKVFSRFPDLLSIVNDVTTKKLSDLRDQTQSVLQTLIEGQMCAVFTNDSFYLTARDDLLAKTADNDMGQAETIFIKEIKERLDGYFKIVVKVLNDTVPKMIGFFLVKQSQDTLQMVLFNELNHEQIFQSLGEPKEVEEQRKRLSARIQTLQKSLKALKRDPTVSKLMQDVQSDND